MRVALAAAVGLAVGLAIGACRYESAYRSVRVTGTCAGACDHYLACKRTDDPATRSACIAECGQVFQDEESLRAFESLECDDTVEYVEGPSGRGPGQLVGEAGRRR